MAEKREITIYDIAERLSLSPSTVSRGLRNHPAIRKDTIARIQEMAAEMNYQQNTFASNLRSNRSNTIGVILPRFESSFLSSVVSSIEKVIRSKGYNLLVSQSYDSKVLEKENLLTLFNNRVEGLLINLTPETTDLSHLDLFLKKGIPVVLFDRVRSQHGCGCTTVSIDNKQAGYDVTKHLISQGCKRIVYLGENTTCPVFGERAKGYWQALAEHGLDADPELIIETHLNTDTGAEVVARILKMKNRPDGIFAGNDMAAASLMFELKKAGVAIPDEMAISGFNNTYISEIVEPSLTTVHYPADELGREAASSLMEILDQENQVSARNIILGHELIVRESSLRIQTK
ncbi:MAG: LacI family DNA-binding transcriptional regulator [Bacteroides sp.]|nr:LacI family DNA-binding transcriptional regulator [Bacteroides sp.]